jgi:hypothetical protein
VVVRKIFAIAFVVLLGFGLIVYAFSGGGAAILPLGAYHLFHLAFPPADIGAPVVDVPLRTKMDSISQEFVAPYTDYYEFGLLCPLKKPDVKFDPKLPSRVTIVQGTKVLLDQEADREIARYFSPAAMSDGELVIFVSTAIRASGVGNPYRLTVEWGSQRLTDGGCAEPIRLYGRVSRRP